MPVRGLGQHAIATRVLFGLTFLTFFLALLAGGGQGSLVESLTTLPALALVVVATHLVLSDSQTDVPRPWFWALPAGLLALPLLQLVPLPHAIWTALPGRGPLIGDASAAGVTRAWGAWSLSPIATEAILWSAIVPVAVFMAACLLSAQQRQALALGALAFAALSAFVGLWQLMEGPTSRLYLYRITNEGEAVGLFANRNHLAALLAASLPVAAGMLADRLRRHVHGVRDLQVWLLTALIILLSVAVTATRSRAGFILFMLSVIASAAVLYRARGSRQWAGARRWLPLAGAVAAVMIVQLTLVGMLSRVEKDPLDSFRGTLTANTLQAARPTHGVGYGLGTFVPAYDEIGDASADIPYYANHAHNDLAELWLEGGIAAVLLVVGALTLLAATCVRLWREGRVSEVETHPDHGLEVGAAFALWLLVLHSIVDYPLRTLTLAVFAALMAAILASSARRHTSGEKLAIPV